MLSDQEFRLCCDAALDDLYRALGRAANDHEFDPDMNQGALTVTFEDPPAKFVVSPQAPVRQIWLSAQSRSYKFDWDAARSAFVLPDSGFTLKEQLAALIGSQLGESVTL
jgi:CyaY protein